MVSDCENFGHPPLKYTQCTDLSEESQKFQSKPTTPKVPLKQKIKQTVKNQEAIHSA